jgi:hypothetical protein
MTEKKEFGQDDPARIAVMLPELRAALIRLGYSRESLLWDAALRMARTPELAGDMIAYAASGQPAPDFEKKTPATLFRPLPEYYNVALLMRDFAFKPVGAFLLASDLLSDPGTTTALLRTFIQDGYWVDAPDGKHELRYPPVAKKYSRCPECDAVLFTDNQTCQECGTVLKDEHAAPAAPAPAVICRTCNSPVMRGNRFCSTCGSPVPATVPAAPQPPSVCPVCGNPLKAGAKFCRSCGKKIE